MDANSNYLHGQYGQDVHANPSQLQHGGDQTGHHGAYGYNSLHPGYGHNTHMYYHPSVGMLPQGAPGTFNNMHHQQHTATNQHHANNMALNAYGGYQQAQVAQQPQAPVGKKTAAPKAGRPRKKKDEVEVNNLMMAAPPAMNIMMPGGQTGRGTIPAAAAEKGKKKEEKKKEPKKIMRSRLKQPKQAPSAWQLFFTEELQKMRADKPDERLNVAHVAKGAGERYNALPQEQKDKYQSRSLELKAQWERDMQAWKESLSPEDIKMENAFRTQQRKAGKSRKSNLKDPHAPKKPLSAYFLFLRAIRSSTKMTQDIFGKEGETTKQSVLAAEKWRGLSEPEKQPYLIKAEQDKTRYEEAKRVYDEAQKRGVNPADAAAQAAAAGKAAADKMAEAHPSLRNLPSHLAGDVGHDDDSE